MSTASSSAEGRESSHVNRRYFFDEGIRFECTQCGACCTGAPGRVLLARGESHHIATFLGLTPERFLAEYARPTPDGMSLLEKNNGDCIFLKENRCSIQPVKPRQCSTFPFWVANMRNEKAWAATQARCEGIGRGPVWSREQLLKLMEEEMDRA